MTSGHASDIEQKLTELIAITKQVIEQLGRIKDAA
jgi:hypothetical protein